jgi:D-sedoheptulose 7-phosphate isomerase
MGKEKGTYLKEVILQLVQDGVAVKERFFQENIETLINLVRCIVDTFRRGNKILIFGNGGSAADAQHLAAEFVNRFLFDRPPLPAIALTTDSSVMTSIGNDFDFSLIFARQIEAIGHKGDIAWGMTTSGQSPNVLAGFRQAKKQGLVTVAFTGKNGGEVLAFADYGLHVKAMTTPRIQETHIVTGHIICELVEKELFPRGDGSEAKI